MLVRVENSVPYTVNFMKGGSAISWILAISLSTILELARKGGSMEPYLDPPLVCGMYVCECECEYVCHMCSYMLLLPSVN